MTKSAVVETQYGRVRGLIEEGLQVFRGIPYAAPPVGELRWKATQPHAGWEGVLSVEQFGLSAPQPFMPGGSPITGEHGSPPFGEDCLTLNIWAPEPIDSLRPVMVWIHGGGLLTGSGSVPQYAGDTFARDGDLVVVNMNYRLGALGFLSGMGDRENVWLDDLATVVRWVVDNIAAFGGDPARITLAGQSGGAFAIGALLQHPKSRGLFQRAILQSLPFGCEIQSTELAFGRTQQLANLLGHGDNVQALSEEPWESLIDGSIGVIVSHTDFGDWPLAFLPVYDETMPIHPLDALANSDIELIVGWTQDESTFGYALEPRYADASQSEVLTWLGARRADAHSSYAAYAADGAHSPLEVLTATVTDDLLRRGSFELLERRASAIPAFAYEFRVDSAAFEGRLGATHCFDLPFTFRNLDLWSSAGFIEGLDPEVYERISVALHSGFISFIQNGVPESDGVTWPQYTGPSREILVVRNEGIHPDSDVTKNWTC